MKKAVVYLRVSTDAQAEKYGLDAQLHEITKYTEQHGIEIVEIFREEGVSGAKDLDDRLELARMLEYCREHADELDYVFVHSLSRLARDLVIQERVIQDLIKMGVELKSILEPDLCSDDPTRELIRKIIGAFNEYERKIIAARMKMGRLQKASQGGHAGGQVPTGYKVVVDGNKKVIQVDEEEAEIVRLIFDLKERGMSYRDIADYLNREGYKPKRSEKFSYSTVRGIHQNPKYKGIVIYRESGKKIVRENEAFRLV